MENFLLLADAKGVAVTPLVTGVVAVVVSERMVVPEVTIVWGSALLRGRMSYLMR